MIIYQENKYYIPQTVAGDVYAKQMLKHYNKTGSDATREDSTNSIQITIRQQIVVDEVELMRRYVEGGYKV